jgi:hypothetical protein
MLYQARYTIFYLLRYLNLQKIVRESVPSEKLPVTERLCVRYTIKVTLRESTSSINSIIRYYIYYAGARGGVVIKAVRYKPAGRRFDSRCCH